MIARLMGAAPLYAGSTVRRRLNVPSRGIAHTASGSIRKAYHNEEVGVNLHLAGSESSRPEAYPWLEHFETMSLRIFLYVALYQPMASSCSLVGHCHHGLYVIASSTRRSRLATANSGVPKNTILRSFFPFSGFLICGARCSSLSVVSEVPEYPPIRIEYL